MDNNKIIEYIIKLLQEKNINDYLGIIAYGSNVRNTNNSCSDLDIMIIKEKYDTSDVGSINIDNQRIEYFIQDITKLYKLIAEEVDNNNPSHLTKFINCMIVSDETGEISNFIEYAKYLYNKSIKKEFTDYDRFNIFSINNKIEDLESLIGTSNFNNVYFNTLERIRNTYSKINGIIELPISKIQKIYEDKDYSKNYIGNEVHTLPNNEFIKYYLECLEIDKHEIMLNKIKDLFSYSFNDLEYDPNNFHLRFKGKTPFRV